MQRLRPLWYSKVLGELLGVKSLAVVLQRNFEILRTSGSDLKRTAADEAAFLGISPSHLSRLVNGKVPLTDKLVERFAAKFGAEDQEYEERVRSELLEVRGDKRSAQATNISSITVDEVARLFERLSKRECLLCVDYRDIPQATDRGHYPRMADRAVDAVNKGLSFALFQPFGTPDAISKKLGTVISASKDSPDTKPLRDAYGYLLKIAEDVRDIYIKMRDKVNGAHKDRIVLYEYNGVPSIFSCGIASRLFYACSYEEKPYIERFYEWVVAASKHDGEHYFIERDSSSINLTAIRQQFHPIPDYWLKNNFTLPKSQLQQAYDQFVGIRSIEGNRGLVWQVHE